MTDRIKVQLEQLRAREYRKTRTHRDMDATAQLSAMNEFMRNANLMAMMTLAQEPRLMHDDRIGFHRSQADYPYVILDNGDRFSMFHGCGNIVPDYETAMKKGMDALLDEVKAYRSNAPADKKTFYDAVILSVEAALTLADRYREHCLAVGATELYEVLCVVPHKPAQTFHQACVFLKSH